ncbi:sde2-like protein [Plakobranchus ocellatus]|uniref:Sde2-like protein n=1 Tax=Plakobranchus ocellatus TaxID=259542 RepID=A0AAV3XT91_9GAST|nr:sde2-like protein [Plakobranchus ocellatus]
MFINYVCCLERGQIDFPPNSSVEDLLTAVLNVGCKEKHDKAFYVTSNGKKQDKSSILEKEKTYHLVPRVLGGKGGFGSMLRAIGAQIEKTTSREACRDLSGRRMRDINNEKKLKEWLAKEAEREQEREERKRDRLAKHLRPQHKFDDAEYHEQKAKVQEDLQDALSTGLKRKMKNGDRNCTAQNKKTKTEWLGVDIDSDDLDSSDSDMEANPGILSGSLQQDMTNCDREDRVAASSSSQGVTDTDIKDEATSSEGSCLFNLPISPHLTKSLACGPQVINSDKCKAAPNRDSDITSATDVQSDTPVDLDDFNSSSELQALGLDRLKHALTVRGLKCGGTLEERADRLMIVKGLSVEEIQASYPILLAKGTGKGGKGKKFK